jgi:hypothetical protein
MAVIGINYSGYSHDYNENDERIEIDPSDPRYFKYVSVYLHTIKEDFEFKSDNFVKDWYDAKKKYMKIMDEEPFLSASSNVNHFQSDGGKFDSAYLHIVEGEPVLKYCIEDDSLEMMEKLILNREIYEKGWEFFVPENTQPTWEELKEMCK